MSLLATRSFENWAGALTSSQVTSFRLLCSHRVYSYGRRPYFSHRQPYLYLLKRQRPLPAHRLQWASEFVDYKCHAKQVPNVLGCSLAAVLAGRALFVYHQLTIISRCVSPTCIVWHRLARASDAHSSQIMQRQHRRGSAFRLLLTAAAI